MDTTKTKSYEANLAKIKSRIEGIQAKKQVEKVSAQLPLWAEAVRCLPNEIVRSALFNARSKTLPRAYLKNAQIAVIGDGQITYTGFELRQDDETVWLQLIHLAKGRPLGEFVEFTAYSFLKSIGWSINQKNYERLRECLTRMQANALAIDSQRLKKADEYLEGGVSLSMIPRFEWENPATKTPLKKYRVKVAPELVRLFADDQFTHMEWQQRLALPNGIATWLHGYYASSKRPFDIKFETIRTGCGLTTESPKKVVQLVKKALDALKDVGFLEAWNITDKGLVSVTRAKT